MCLTWRRITLSDAPHPPVTLPELTFIYFSGAPRRRPGHSAGLGRWSSHPPASGRLDMHMDVLLRRRVGPRDARAAGGRTSPCGRPHVEAGRHIRTDDWFSGEDVGQIPPAVAARSIR